jgi:WD40 repeat protein
LIVGAATSAQPRTDPHGDPLPEGAIARFGTVRYRIGEVGPFALSADGKAVAVGTEHHVTLWDVETGRLTARLPIASLPAHSVSGATLALSSDGKYFARILRRDLRVFDARTGRERHAIELSDHGRGVFFFPGTARFAVVDLVETDDPLRVLVYDAETGRRVSILRTEAEVDRLSGSGRYYLGQSDGVPHLVDVRTGRVRQRFPEVRGLADREWVLSPDDRRVFVLETSGRLRTYDAETGKLCDDLEAPPGWGDETKSLHLSVSTDGKVAYLSGWHRPIFRRDLSADQWLPPLPTALASGRLLASHPNGKLFLALAADGVLRRYDLATRKEVPPPHGFANLVSAALSPDGRRVAVVSGHPSDRLDLFDDRGRLLGSDRSHEGLPEPFWTPDGRLFCAGRDLITRRDRATGKLQRTVAARGSAPELGRGATFSPGGDWLVVPSGDGSRLVVFDTSTQEWAAILPTGGAVRAVSPDGRTVAAETPTGVAVVDLQTGLAHASPPEAPTGHRPYPTTRLAFSPDGSYLLSWDDDGVAVLRDPATAARVRPIATGERWPPDSAFSPDGLYLATGSQDGTVTVYDTGTGRAVWSRCGHRDRITRVAYGGPARLASSSHDLTALLWDLRADRKPATPAWDALSGPDALEAYRAIWALSADKAGPDLLRSKVQPVRPPRPEQVRQWLADLGSERFAVRETATRGLRHLGRLVEPDLRAARPKATGEEVRARLDALLAGIVRERTPSERINARAVTALELAGTEAATKVLADWAAGAPAARLTQDARAALSRLKARSPGQ